MIRDLAVSVVAIAALSCGRRPDGLQPVPVADLDPAVNMGSVVNGATFDGGPSLTPDGLVLYFASDRIGGSGGADLWIASRAGADAHFSPPHNLGPNVNSGANESAPDIAADGLALFFDSDRPDGFGSYDLWIALRTRLDEPFGVPANLGAGVNTAASEGHPHLSPDGLTLYFQRRGTAATGDVDIWMATRAHVGDQFSQAVRLGGSVNSPHFDGEPSVSADGLTLYFTSDRPGGLGARDLWVAHRTSQNSAFGPGSHLGSTVNTAAQDVTPSISRDGSVLYFMSDRPGGMGGLDLWMARVRRLSPEDGQVKIRPARISGKSVG
jgi:Tol biopolymer transport system component